MKTLTKTRYQKYLNEYAKTHADRSVRQFNTIVQNSLDERMIATDFIKKAAVKGQGAKKSEEEKYINFADFVKLLNLSSEKIDSFYSTRLMIYIFLELLVWGLGN